MSLKDHIVFYIELFIQKRGFVVIKPRKELAFLSQGFPGEFLMGFYGSFRFIEREKRSVLNIT